MLPTKLSKMQLRISFTEYLMNRVSEDQDVKIQISVTGDAIEVISIENYLEYACSDDKCDFEFVKNYTSWFIHADKPDLIDQLAPFILGDDDAESGQCLNENKKGENCSSGHCVAIIRQQNDGSLRSFPFCAADDDMNAAGLWFSMEFDIKFQRHTDWEYTFSCKYANCNDIPILNNVMRVFRAQYEILAIAKVFGYRNQGGGEKEETTPASTKSSTSTIEPVKSSAIPSPVTNSYNNTTPTNTTGTTTKLNHAMQSESHKTLIYTAFIIIHCHLLFLV